MILYKIEPLPAVKKVGLNLMDGDDFTTQYIIDTITNSPEGHQLSTQAKNLWIIAINGEDPITTKGALDELKFYHTKPVNYKVNTSLFRMNIHQNTDLEEL